jgi:hypothetical protein
MKELDVNEVNEQEYYVISDADGGAPLYIHKEKSAPSFFRGCFDYCYSIGLSTIYKDPFCRWSMLAILTDEIADAFLDWASMQFDMLHSPLLASEARWEKHAAEYEARDFRLVVLRGNLDMYCMLRYLRTCAKDEKPLWDDLYKKIELEYATSFV